MGINHGRPHVLVTQELLYGSDVLTILQYPSFFPSWLDEAKLAKAATVANTNLFVIEIDILNAKANTFHQA